MRKKVTIMTMGLEIMNNCQKCQIITMNKEETKIMTMKILLNMQSMMNNPILVRSPIFQGNLIL